MKIYSVINEGKKFTQNEIDDFVKAANEGDLQTVINYLKDGMNVNAKDRGGDTALIVANNIKSINVVKELLNLSNIDVDITNEFGNTALILASNRNTVETVKELLKHGADPDITTPSGYKAIDVTTNPEIKQMLLRFMKSNEGEI